MKNPKQIVIAGASGYLGRRLMQHFLSAGHRVTGLSRQPLTHHEQPWDGRTPGPWMSALEGCDLLINLAGRSVNCRYHRRNREQILLSRVESTRILGMAVENCAKPPEVWMNSGSATIYRHAEDRPMDEATGEIGHGFSVEVCKAWEAEFEAAAPNLKTPALRKVILRSAMVMGPGKGGVFAAFHNIVKLGFGLGSTITPNSRCNAVAQSPYKISLPPRAANVR